MSKTCTMRFDSDEDQDLIRGINSLRDRYSVSATAAGRPVQVHADADRIVIRQDGMIVGEQARAFDRNQTVYDPWPYMPVLARKPGALRSAPLKAPLVQPQSRAPPFKDRVLPPAMAAIRRKLKGSDDGDRQMVQSLSCVRDDGLMTVDAACREALAQGVHPAPVIINILARRRDASPPPLLLTPTALRLAHEPVADYARYAMPKRTGRHGTHPNPRPDGNAEALRDAQCPRPHFADRRPQGRGHGRRHQAPA